MNVHKALALIHIGFVVTLVTLALIPPHDPWWLDPACYTIAASNAWMAYKQWSLHLAFNRQ